MDSAGFRLVKLPPLTHTPLVPSLSSFSLRVHGQCLLCPSCAFELWPLCNRSFFHSVNFVCVCAHWVLDILNSGEPDKDVTESYFSNCIALSWGYTGSLLEAWKGRAIHEAVGGLCEQPHLQSFSKRGCVFSGLSSLLNGCKSYWLLLGRPFLLSHMAWSVISISSHSSPSWLLGLPLLRHHQKWS